MCIPRIKSICASHCYGGWYGRFKKSQNLPLLHKVSFKLKKGRLSRFKDRRYFVLYSYIHMLESTLIFQEIK
ncbi:unnamed protein product [Rhizophagus irregularis]|nr:unnamed protein product [Rhizophagus irregularis]